MVKLRTGAVVMLVLLFACKGDEGDEDAGLFGEGGPGMPEVTDGDDPGTTGGTDSGLDDAPPPPPPPPPPDDDTTGGTMPGTDSSDGGTTGEPAGSSESSDEGDTFNDGTLDVQVITQSMFPTGQCDDVIVTNVSGMAVTWEVELPLPGTINQLWNAEVVEMGGTGLFTGVAFNAMLAPGAQAAFGYCVDY